MESKWFATSLPQAIQFGWNLVYRLDKLPFHVIRVSFGRDFLKRMHYGPNQDMLGRSWCVPEELLPEFNAACTISEVLLIPIDEVQR